MELSMKFTDVKELKFLEDITRLEIIEHGEGRVFVHDPRTKGPIQIVMIDIQDEGRTLKIFIEPRKSDESGVSKNPR